MERALRQNLLPLPRRHGLEARELARHGRRPRGAVAAAAGDASFTARGRRGDDGLVLFAEADVDVNTAGPEAPRDERVGLAPLVAGGVGAVDAHDGVEEAEAAARERDARGRRHAADVDAALPRERRALGEAGGARVQRDAGVAARREGDGVAALALAEEQHAARRRRQPAGGDGLVDDRRRRLAVDVSFSAVALVPVDHRQRGDGSDSSAGSGMLSERAHMNIPPEVQHKLQHASEGPDPSAAFP